MNRYVDNLTTRVYNSHHIHTLSGAGSIFKTKSKWKLPQIWRLRPKDVENLMRQLNAIIKRKTTTLILSPSCAYKVAHTLGHGLFGPHFVFCALAERKNIRGCIWWKGLSGSGVYEASFWEGRSAYGRVCPYPRHQASHACSMYFIPAEIPLHKYSSGVCHFSCILQVQQCNSVSHMY